jgi:hypothetical protein
LDNEDAKLPSEKLSDLIDKGVKKEVAKQVVVIKRQMRKNSLGEVKIQISRPRKNGQASKRKSKASANYVQNSGKILVGIPVPGHLPGFLVPESPESFF